MIKKQWHCNKCFKVGGFDFSDEFNQVCSVCNTTLDLVYEGVFSWSELDDNKQGVLRYSNLIPVTQESLEVVCTDEQPEFTKPIESKKLASILGVKSVHLVSPVFGPSGTFKDIEAAVVIAKCLDWKITKRLSWHSTGNTARAYREYSIRANFDSDSYFPLVCIDKFKGVKKSISNLLIGYDGPFQNISAIAKKRAAAHDTLHLAPLNWKVEGKALLSYNIFENLPNSSVIVQTIAGGYGVLGLQLGINRLKQLKVIEETLVPRYELFQIEEADVISRLMPLNRDVQETDLKLPVNPFEPTLQSTNPLSTFNILRKIVVETDSNVSSVSVQEVEDAHKIFEEECNDLGIPISYADEKSPFISWAGLIQPKSKQRLNPDDTVVIIVTGARKRAGDIPTADVILKD